jgi:hypothetical protein
MSYLVHQCEQMHSFIRSRPNGWLHVISIFLLRRVSGLRFGGPKPCISASEREDEFTLLRRWYADGSRRIHTYDEASLDN